MDNSPQIKIASRDSFKQAIYGHYKSKSENKVPPILLESLCEIITDYYYEQYARFRKDYPKSIKRYSAFQFKDIDHPQTKIIIIDFFKNYMCDKYREYTKLLLSITDKELDDFEQWRRDYERL